MNRHWVSLLHAAKLSAKTVASLFLILAASAACLADTTWVSGAVSGNWTVAGSPYVISDSVWINPTDTLVVSAGVEIILPDPASRFTWAGVCRFEGTAADSVVVDVRHVQAKIRGTNQHRARLVRCNYTEFRGQGSFWVYADTTHFLHSNFQTESDHIYWTGVRITANHSHLRDLEATNVSLTLDTTTISGQVGTYGTGTLTARLVAYVPEADGWHDPNSGLLYAHSSDPTCGAAMVQNCTLAGLGLCAYDTTRAVLVRNCRIDGLTVCRSFHMDIRNNSIGRVGLSNCQGTLMQNSIQGDGNTIEEYSTVLFQQNTFVYTGDCIDCARSGFLDVSWSTCNATLTSNIFYSTQPTLQVFRYYPAELPAPPRYNLVWGMDDPWRGRTLGAGNLTADPLFDPNSGDYRLQFDSPAINAGDPALTDSDGTISDIGARWWDHRYDHPPVIGTPRHIETRWGQRLNLTISASDEGSVRLVLPPIIPAWLCQAPAVAGVVSTCLFSGRVPYGVPSFSLPVKAIDRLGQTDTDTIRVEVRPTSVLTDTVSGTLTATYSPYSAGQDIVVPAGDSLIIEPGVHLLMDSVSCASTLVVNGRLLARGTAQDSIHFESQFGRAWAGVWFRGSEATGNLDYCRLEQAAPIFKADSIESCRVEHSTFVGAPSFMNFDMQFWQSSDSVIFRESEIRLDGMATFSCDHVLFERCLIQGQSDGRLTFFGGEDALVRDCAFRAMPSYSIDILSPARITVERCLFQHAQPSPAISLYGVSSARVIRLLNNTFAGPASSSVVGSVAPEDSVIITNNIFTDVRHQVFLLNDRPDTSRFCVGHNCFWHDSLLAEFLNPGDPWASLGAIVTTNANGDSTDIYGNLFLDPLFADTFSYHLTEGSPCIDAGADIGLPYTGQAPDIGCWEYGLSAMSKPPVEQLDDGREVVVYPNPTNGTAIVQYQIRTPQFVDICIYNILGQRVTSYSMHLPESGSFPLENSVPEFGSGQYFLVLGAKGWRLTRPFTIIR